MPRFLSRLAGVSLQTELLMMTLVGLANSILDWRSFDWSNQLKEIENLQPSQHGGEWAKIILKWIVIARILVAHVHTFSYLMNFYSILTWSRPHFLLPGIVIGFFKNLVLDGLTLFVGINLWYEEQIPSLLLMEFVIVKSIPLALSSYNWWSTVGFFKQLKRIEKIRKMRKALLHSDSGFGHKGKIGSDSFEDGSGTLLVGKRQRCVSFLSFDDFFCQTSLESLEVDQRISKSLTTLLTMSSSMDSDETDDSALQIIDDPDLTPLEKSMRILGITDEDVRIARAKSRYTLAERADRKRTMNGTGWEEPFFWKEDGQTQTARFKRNNVGKRERKREIVEGIKEGEAEEVFIREEHHVDAMPKNIGQTDWNAEETKSEDDEPSLKENSGVIEMESDKIETSEIVDIVIEKDIEEEEITKPEDTSEEIKVPAEEDAGSKDEELTDKDHETCIESSRECSPLKEPHDCVEKEKEEIQVVPRKDERKSHYPCDPFVGKQKTVGQANEKDITSGKIDPEKQLSDKWQICECPDKINNRQGNIESVLENENLIYIENMTDQTGERELDNSQRSNLYEISERTKGLFKITNNVISKNSNTNMFFCDDISVTNPRTPSLLHDMKNNHENVVIEVKNKIESFTPLLYKKISSPVQFFMSINEQFKANLCPAMGNYDYFETFLKFPFSTHEMYRRYGRHRESLRRESSEIRYMIRPFGKDVYPAGNTSEMRLSGGYTFPRTNNFEDTKVLENMNSVSFKRPGLFNISEFARFVRNDGSRCPLLWPFWVNQSTQFENVEKKWGAKGNVQNIGKFPKKDISTQVKAVRRSKLPVKYQETSGSPLDSTKLPKLRTLKIDKSVETFMSDQIILKADQVQPNGALKCTPKEFLIKYSKITNTATEESNPLLASTIQDISTSVQANNYVWKRTDSIPEDESPTSSEASSPRTPMEKQPIFAKPPTYPKYYRNTNIKKLLPNDNHIPGNNEPFQGKLADVQVQCSRSLKTRRKQLSVDERKARELEALRAYNEVTLLEDKRRLEAKRRKSSSSNDIDNSSQSSGALQIIRNDNNYKQNRLESNDTSNRFIDVDEHPGQRIAAESFDESRDAGIENEVNRMPQASNTIEAGVREASESRIPDNVQSDHDRIRTMGNLMSLSFSENKHTLSKLQSIDGRAAEMILELLNNYDASRLKHELKRIQETRNQDSRKRYSRYSSSKKEREALNSSTTSCKGAEGLQIGQDLERIPAKEDVRNETSRSINYDLHPVHSVHEDNRFSTIKPYTRREERSLSTISMESTNARSEEIVTSGRQEISEEQEVHEEDPEASTNLQQHLRKSINLNLPDVVSDVTWTFQPGGVVFANKNLQQRSTDPETLLGVYPRDIVDEETASLIHRAFFTKPEVIVRTFRQERASNGDDVVPTLEEAFSVIHQDASVDDMVIRAVDELNIVGGEEIYDSNTDNVQVDIQNLGNTLLRALRNSQIPNEDMIMIIEENNSSAESSRTAMDEQLQDFTLNLGCSERSDCTLKNGDNSRENLLEMPMTFWMNFFNGVEIIPNPEESRNIENKEENIMVPKELTEEISKSSSGTPEDETPCNLELSTMMKKRLGTKLTPIEAFNENPGPSMVTKAQVSPQVQHSSRSDRQGNLQSFPARFEYAVVSHQPRRGHGLSSGYLMDFNSEGTLAVAQPTVSTNPSNISGGCSRMSSGNLRNLMKSLRTPRIPEVSKTSTVANNCEGGTSQCDPRVENGLRDNCIAEETEIRNSEFVGGIFVGEEKTEVLKKNVEIQNDRLPLRTLLMFTQIVFMFYFQYFVDYFRRFSSIKSTKSTFTSSCYELHTVSTSTSRLLENYTSMQVPENWKTIEKFDKNIGNDFSSSTIDLTTKSFDNDEEFNSEERVERLIEPRSAMSLSEEIREITLDIKNIFSSFMDRFVEFVEDGPSDLPSGSSRNQDYEPQKSFYLLQDSHEDIVTVHEEIDLERSVTPKDILPRIEEIVDEFPEVKEGPGGPKEIINSLAADFEVPRASVDVVQELEREPGLQTISTDEDSQGNEREEIDVPVATNSVVAEEKTEIRFEENDSFDSTYTRGSVESGNEVSTIECSSMEEFSKNSSRVPSATQNSPTEDLPEEADKSSKVT